MIYPYVNENGDYREVVAPMSDAPPTVFVEKGVEWSRVWPGLQHSVKKGEGVHHKGQDLPVSMSLPDAPETGWTEATEYGHKVRKYKDGTMATMDGQYIVADNDTPKKLKDAYGVEKMED